MVNVANTARELAKLGVLKFFPADKEARAALVQIVCEMASSDEQIAWLVKRALALYNEWPGPHELRACFCSKFPPRDGINAYSQVYIDGIPSEREERNRLEGPKMLALPPGHEVTADPEMEAAAVEAFASMPKMPTARPINDSFERSLREVLTAPKDRPEIPKTPQIITQEDIDKAVAELHAKKAASEESHEAEDVLHATD